MADALTTCRSPDQVRGDRASWIAQPLLRRGELRLLLFHEADARQAVGLGEFDHFAGSMQLLDDLVECSLRVGLALAQPDDGVRRIRSVGIRMP